jgi:hypothetical protein
MSTGKPEDWRLPPLTVSRMRVAIVALSALYLLDSRALAAQATRPLSEVQPGARVRVEAPGVVAGRFVGTVLTRTGDSVTLGNPAGAPVALPFSRATSIEISRGKSRSAGALRGVMWGVPIGLALGAFTAALSEECVAATCEELTTAEALGAGTVGGAFWGAVIGAIVGRERWERFDQRARTSLRFDPASRAVAISISH